MKNDLFSPNLGGTRHAVRLRGLPYSAEEGDITNFFAPLVVIRIEIERDSLSRPSGAAEVEFQSHQDALEAMKKDRQHIGTVPTVTLLDFLSLLRITIY